MDSPKWIQIQKEFKFLTPTEITIEQKDWNTWMIAFLVWDYQIDQRFFVVIDIMDDLGFSFAIERGYDGSTDKD